MDDVPVRCGEIQRRVESIVANHFIVILAIRAGEKSHDLRQAPPERQLINTLLGGWLDETLPLPMIH